MCNPDLGGPLCQHSICDSLRVSCKPNIIQTGPKIPPLGSLPLVVIFVKGIDSRALLIAGGTIEHVIQNGFLNISGDTQTKVGKKNIKSH
jgi:hypothetical protein